MHRGRRVGRRRPACDPGAPARPSGRAPGMRPRFRSWPFFPVDRCRLPDRIPPERPAARAAWLAGGGNLFRLRDTGMFFLW